MFFHPGRIESCHEPKDDVKYYCENHYNQDFITNLQKGDFITCGNSGGNHYCFVNDHLRPISESVRSNIGQLQPIFSYNSEYLNKQKDKYGTCCFCFGKFCGEKILKRRWSCCKQEIIGTIYDLKKIKGCAFIYNNF